MLLSGSRDSLLPQRRLSRQSQTGVAARKGFFEMLDGISRPSMRDATRNASSTLTGSGNSRVSLVRKAAVTALKDAMPRPKESMMRTFLGELFVAANVVCVSRTPPRKLMPNIARRTLRAGFTSPENNINLIGID